MADETKLSRVELPWCEEFQNMMNGHNFDGSKSDIMQSAKLNVRRLVQAFNDQTIRVDDTFQSLKHRRMEVAKLLLGGLGENCNIEAPFYCGWGFNIVVGTGVYINRDVSIQDNGRVIIGDGVRVGPSVCLFTDTHEVDPDMRRENGGSFALPIKIGDDCWIGANATILPGVTTGKGSTVASGAVVTKDIPEYSLAGGVPAKVIKELRE